MAKYAVVHGNTVSNVIEAETEEIAIQVSGANFALETEGEPWIGWSLIDGVWVNPNIDLESVDA